MGTSNNVDPSEIEHFNSIADQWWELKGDFAPLHKINPIRMDYIAKKINLAGLKVIDVGCGGGILSESLAKHGAIVTGVDMSPDPLRIAREHAVGEGLDIHYLQTTAEEIADREPGQFDVVCCMELLEHVPDPKSVINACRTLLKPNGMLFLSTISRTPKAMMLAIVGAEYLLRWVPKGTHTYEKFIKPSELASMARDAGLSFEDATGIVLNPLTQAFKLSSNTDVNYLAYCTLP
jgi:2-polyprenyl-6-hydroxyphenyl methylase/3-demethylubiquinone-9 3-methyltransferase